MHVIYEEIQDIIGHRNQSGMFGLCCDKYLPQQDQI